MKRPVVVTSFVSGPLVDDAAAMELRTGSRSSTNQFVGSPKPVPRSGPRGWRKAPGSRAAMSHIREPRRSGGVGGGRLRQRWWRLGGGRHAATRTAGRVGTAATRFFHVLICTQECRNGGTGSQLTCVCGRIQSALTRRHCGSAVGAHEAASRGDRIAPRW